jgi:cytochrome c oxidase subunit II
VTRRGRRLLRISAAAGATAVVVSGCSSSFGMPRGASEQGRDIFDLWQVFMVAGILVAALVYGLIVWSLIRYRRRRGDREDALGRQFGSNVPLEIAYTAIPIVIVIVLFTLSVRTGDRVGGLSSAPDVRLDVRAFSWGWRFTYPDLGVVVVSQPSGEDVVGPVILLPAGRTTQVVLTSEDVIHAFWVPGFNFKRDAIPGHPNTFDLSPVVEGDYRGECAEFCGLNHAFMSFTVRVVDQAAFDAWIASQRGAAA